MQTTLGDDWKSLFELSLANCLKPGFFTKQNPFWEVDQSHDSKKGLKIETEALLKQG